MVWVVSIFAIVGMLWMLLMSKKQITIAYKRGYQDAINNMEIASLLAQSKDKNE